MPHVPGHLARIDPDQILGSLAPTSVTRATIPADTGTFSPVSASRVTVPAPATTDVLGQTPEQVASLTGALRATGARPAGEAAPLTPLQQQAQQFAGGVPTQFALGAITPTGPAGQLIPRLQPAPQAAAPVPSFAPRPPARLDFPTLTTPTTAATEEAAGRVLSLDGAPTFGGLPGVETPPPAETIADIIGGGSGVSALNLGGLQVANLLAGESRQRRQDVVGEAEAGFERAAEEQRLGLDFTGQLLEERRTAAQELTAQTGAVSTATKAIAESQKAGKVSITEGTTNILTGQPESAVLEVGTRKIALSDAELPLAKASLANEVTRLIEAGDKRPQAKIVEAAAEKVERDLQKLRSGQ